MDQKLQNAIVKFDNAIEAAGRLSACGMAAEVIGESTVVVMTADLKLALSLLMVTMETLKEYTIKGMLACHGQAESTKN